MILLPQFLGAETIDLPSLCRAWVLNPGVKHLASELQFPNLTSSPVLPRTLLFKGECDAQMDQGFGCGLGVAPKEDDHNFSVLPELAVCFGASASASLRPSSFLQNGVASCTVFPGKLGKS